MLNKGGPEPEVEPGRRELPPRFRLTGLRIASTITATVMLMADTSMSKKSRCGDTDLEAQEELVRDLIREALKNCGKEREQVAGQLGISCALLNAYCTPSFQGQEKNGGLTPRRRAKFPVSLLAKFFRVTADYRLLLAVMDERTRRLLGVPEIFAVLVRRAK